MYRIRDDKTIEIVRGDSAIIEVDLLKYYIADPPMKADLPTYYEYIDGEYVKTKDTDIVDGKEYYYKAAYEMQEGDSLIFTVKKSENDKDSLIQKIGPYIHLEPEDTELLAYGRYRYDVQFTDANGFVDTVIEPSNFRVKKEVTW